MEIRRHHVIAFVVLQAMIAVIWAVDVWSRKPSGFITAQGALLCPSPDSLEFSVVRPSVADALGCKEFPWGVRVYRADDTSFEPPGVWKVYLYEKLEAGVHERAWGRRSDFLMPDGSVIIEGATVQIHARVPSCSKPQECR
ncbi:hypothetical protein DC522_04910 [Microvirga sp. KLBC 81]|nr:hypothetical protein DC522_04910 [Microvirga sp. KLBC 81]